ncbi:hypothetical protein CCACVL1_01462 [Corchorus capsularis]|uniref:Uncharacterized protein n=1 Tax=Corchorus capsularis TaxID=210143 RepID=A0A1R3KI85_COCAP|nr:hypothetical protein CCACVL1_01462 [Corchorus capsularis]
MDETDIHYFPLSSANELDYST